MRDTPNHMDEDYKRGFESAIAIMQEMLSLNTDHIQHNIKQLGDN